MSRDKTLQKEHKHLLHELRNLPDKRDTFYPHKYRNDRIKEAKLCNCNIDEYGLCKLTRKRGTNTTSYIKPGVCCCANCWASKGYLAHILPHNREFVLKEFLPIVGFWRLDGCALPRRMRSLTCLGYFCEKG